MAYFYKAVCCRRQKGPGVEFRPGRLEPVASTDPPRDNGYLEYATSSA